MDFVHPVEEEFAKILDYYGVKWQYEPKTFALAWDGSGDISEAFTPDFYLPDEDLYIEITTLRPKLITKKNGKIRRLRELYPEVNVKLFNRNDLRQMMLKYGRDEHAAPLVGTKAQNHKKS